MSFARLKRLMVGWLALLAPLPLPFNEIISWPLLLVYLALVGYFLKRASAGAERWLPNWVLNVLALAYVPFFVLDFRQLSGGRLIIPLVHLLMFAVVVKIFALNRERDKWQCLVGVFFLFLASMATSTHLSVLFFLGAFVGLSLLLLVRFACLHILATYGYRDPAPALLPMSRFLVLSGLGILLLAVPFFMFLPRVRSPYLVLDAAGVGGLGESTGYSDEVTLDSLGRIRENREVVMRLTYTRPPAASELRFKVGAHDRFNGVSWARAEGRSTSIVREPGFANFMLEHRNFNNSVNIWLQPLLPQRLVLPLEAVGIGVNSYSLNLTPGGTVELSSPATGVLVYTVDLAPSPVMFAPPPDGSPSAAVLDTRGVTPEMAALAAEVMGSGNVMSRVQSLERFLKGSYGYTLDFVGRSGPTSLSDFLFKYKSGHCEYFASSMVLLLRSQGVPARLVTGFLGADYNPIEGYFIVRQLNAHAWVEAYVEGEGWRTFDPTPAAGRPATTRTSVWTLVSQAFDYLTFRWDRYVLSYGFGDQVQLLMRLKDLWTDFWRDLSPRQAASPTTAEPVPASETPARDAEGFSTRSWGVMVLALMALFAGFAWWWRRRQPPSPAAAYRRLRRLAAEAKLEVPESLPPLALLARLEAHDAELGEAAETVVELYLAETFGGRAATDAEREVLPKMLARARQRAQSRRRDEARQAVRNKRAPAA